METSSSENGNKINVMATENIYGKREEKSTREGGSQIKEMGEEFIQTIRDANMMEIGAMMRCMEMVYMLGMIVQSMQEDGFMVFSVAMENSGKLMGGAMKEVGKMEDIMDKENWSNLMEISISEAS